MTSYPDYGSQGSINPPQGRGQPPYGNSSSPQDYPPQAGRGYDTRRQGPPNTLPRSISTANLKEKIDYCRDVMIRDLVTKPPIGGTSFFNSTPSSTLTLPSLSKDDPAFKKFVYDNLTDRAMQKLLEEQHILNWCSSVSEVVTLDTLRDGNCLLHAASLGMWGFQDRNVTLRGALSSALGCTRNTLYDRWKYNREIENHRMGVELEIHQWDEEWVGMVRQASSKVQIGKNNFDSLDDFHIFVLANVLRRPIILYAASKIHSLQTGSTLQEINFQGVYLPLLWEPATCKKNPLPLAYDGGHFCALVVSESAKRYQDGQFLLPLVDYYGKQLSVKFTLAVEDNTSLVMDYLKPIQIGCNGSPYITTTHIICARLEVATPPAYLKTLVTNFVDACWDVYKKKAESGRGAPHPQAPGPSGEGVGQRDEEGGGGGEMMKCINNCGRFGDSRHSFLCVECHRKARERELESNANHSPPSRNSQEQRGESGRLRDPPPPQGGGPSSSGTVKCPQCAEPGIPRLLGMCERCYGNNTGNQNDSIYERLPSSGDVAQGASPGEPPALPLPRNSKERSLCRKPDCKYYGTVENRFYCSRCFERDMENILKEADSGPPIRPDTPNSFSPTRAESGHQPREQRPPPVSAKEPGDPAKCYQCNDFYANEEYMGLCNDCFMKSTINGGPAPHGQQQGGSERPPSRDSEAQQPRGHPGGTDRYYNPTAPKSVYNPEPSQGGSRSSRAPNPTAPVTNLESQMADMTMMARCFVCTGGQLGESEQFTVCKNHAMDLFKLLQQQGGKEQVQRESEVRHKLSYGNEAPPSNVRAEPFNYEVPQPFGNEVRSKPSQAGSSARHESASSGENNLDDPQYHDRGQRLGSVSEQDRLGTGYRDHERRGHGNEPGYPQSRDKQQPRYGNEQGWPQPSGEFNREPVGRQGNELDYSLQEGYRNEWERRQSNDFGANEQGHPRREADPYSSQQRREFHPQAITGPGAEGDRRREAGDPYSSQQRREFHPPQGITGRDAQGYAREQYSSQQRQDFHPQATTGRGAEGGAEAVASGDSSKPKVKSLCAKTGCSFKGYERLKKLCPDCYIDEYQKYPDYYSPDEFPLI